MKKDMIIVVLLILFACVILVGATITLIEDLNVKVSDEICYNTICEKGIDREGYYTHCRNVTFYCEHHGY